MDDDRVDEADDDAAVDEVGAELAALGDGAGDDGRTGGAEAILRGRGEVGVRGRGREVRGEEWATRGVRLTWKKNMTQS